MMKDIHNNLALIQPKFFSFLDWFLLLFVVLIFVWIYKSFFYIHTSKNKKQKKRQLKKFTPKKFSFSKEIKTLEKLIKEENWKAFSLESTKVLKLVLEKEFKQYFLFATGKELQEILEKEHITQSQKDNLKEFFSILDPIKFAKKESKKEQIDKIIGILESFHTKNSK